MLLFPAHRPPSAETEGLTHVAHRRRRAPPAGVLARRPCGAHVAHRRIRDNRLIAGIPIQSRSPATQQLLGTVQGTPPQLVAEQVAAAREVQPLWALLRIQDRARYIARIAQGVIDQLDEIVQTLSLEGGRPAAEVAALEALPAIDALIWIAEKGANALAGSRVPVHRCIGPLKRARVEHEPFGVIAVIGAGSAPLAQPLSQVGAALLAGNGVVFKPAVRACLAGEAIAQVVRRAGLPEGLVRVVHGDASTGIALAESPVEKVLFTGSPSVGRRVAAECVSRRKEVTLEVGGKDAMLVLADADIKRAVAGALSAGTAAAGQARGAVERIYVAQEVYRSFVQRLADGAAALTVGNPLDPLVQVGPLASQRRLQHLDEIVQDALQQGAKQLCGGPLLQPPQGCEGAFFAPAVLADVTPQMRAMREPLNGPLLTVSPFSSVQEAIALVNSSEPDLGASIWTADKHGGLRIARELNAGMVWLNDHLPSPMIGAGPWGAAAGSGLGRTLGRSGLRACAQEKLITWDPPKGRGLWWGPYTAELQRAAKAAARLRSHREQDRSRAWHEGASALARVSARALARR